MMLLAAFGMGFSFAGAALSCTTELDSVTRRTIGVICTLTGVALSLLALLISLS